MESSEVSRFRAGDIILGKNPRTHLDVHEMEKMEGSIRAQGILQPILVRRLDDGAIQVVAGYRRLACAKKVFGDDFEIPALCLTMTDTEAEQAALSENVDRDPMSPAEEAEAAAKILGDFNGDREETAKRMGWHRSTLDKRLALMNCDVEVRKALTERKIQLGHAELLAAVPREQQLKVLAKLLDAKEQPKVSELKANLEQIMRPLADVIFDKGDCAGCQHNSGNQTALFAEAVNAGNCTNGSCYESKTVAALEVKKTELQDEFPTVRLVGVGENYTIIKLVAEGNLGVGHEQAKACRGCQNFGAVISTVPGKVGKVFKDQCFDSACNSQKVAARINAEKAAIEPPASPDKTAKASSAPAKAQEPAKTSKPTVSVQDSQRIKEYRVKEWRSALKMELYKDPVKNLNVLLAIGVTGAIRHINSVKVAKGFTTLSNESNTTDLLKVANVFETAGEDVRTKTLQGLAITAMDNIEERALVELMKYVQVDLAAHWVLSEAFFDLMTKSEIEVVADELGLKAAMGEAYAKSANGKKGDFIKALLGIKDFTYTGIVPKAMQYK